MTTRIWLAALALCGFPAMALCAAPALAQQPACTAVSDTNLPPAFAAWGKPAVAVTAGAAAASAARIQPNVAADISLLPAITPVLPPGRARETENPHAGLLLVAIPTPGVWRIGLSGGAWIDLIGPDGKAVQSMGHGHMAPCTTLTKVVEFQLGAGDHLIQISGNAGPTVRLLVSPRP
ncbi:hypothetical protein FJQ54_01490 [Sandaracinobacter neustonicus]|uniref:Homogentisate 1,2-dioxygenase n=1 Tax=Sandaracinobacter neustonicus TaxID=1715348 RepID=A0A501XWL7_9SPHN|nr:hypothetical protein [Sandaracinobacter neustonicus]TPE64477.1 hypothetical protein FJQ54_01490 [Sandaracinobacter neustonicus]